MCVFGRTLARVFCVLGIGCEFAVVFAVRVECYSGTVWESRTQMYTHTSYIRKGIAQTHMNIAGQQIQCSPTKYALLSDVSNAI